MMTGFCMYYIVLVVCMFPHQRSFGVTAFVVGPAISSPLSSSSSRAFSRRYAPFCSRAALHQSQSNDDDNVNPVTKGAWFAVEAFGKVFGQKKDTGSDDAVAAVSTADPPQSMAETMARIKQDNQQEYFLSGQVDKLIYDPDCEFADPFVSFKGRDRFVDNLENLGSFITAYSAKPISYDEGQSEENAVITKFMVKLQLNLPWQPVLAWPWGVKCKIDPETCLIVLHEESWDIDAWEVCIDI